MNLANGYGFYQWRPASCLRVSGDDALTFLQGQFTNDLQKNGSSNAVYGLWLNQKGKVLADSFVRKISEREAWIVSYFSPAAVIRERLEAYIIADDVVIEDVTGTMMGLTVTGTVMPADLGLNESAWVFPGRRMLEAHTEFVFPMSEGLAVRGKLTGGAELSMEHMEHVRMAAGIPAVPADLGPTDLPNEGGLETVAISYTKGCYLGQEVMARLKSMGQVRRRLLRVRGVGEPPVRPALVFQGARKVGELRSAARENAGWIGLALVSLVNLQPDAGLALAADGVPTIKFSDRHE
ncbi:MAG: folate-binding protein [Opitutaceae bacterium]